VAQKRYRESQKRKMADTEDQVAELTAKLNALATEKVRAGKAAAPPEVMEKALWLQAWKALSTVQSF